MTPYHVRCCRGLRIGGRWDGEEVGWSGLPRHDTLVLTCWSLLQQKQRLPSEWHPVKHSCICPLAGAWLNVPKSAIQGLPSSQPSEIHGTAEHSTTVQPLIPQTSWSVSGNSHQQPSLLWRARAAVLCLQNRFRLEFRLEFRLLPFCWCAEVPRGWFLVSLYYFIGGLWSWTLCGRVQRLAHAWTSKLSNWNLLRSGWLVLWCRHVWVSACVWATVKQNDLMFTVLQASRKSTSMTDSFYVIEI